jgi:hypothetical protein
VTIVPFYRTVLHRTKWREGLRDIVMVEASSNRNSLRRNNGRSGIDIMETQVAVLVQNNSREIKRTPDHVL